MPKKSNFGDVADWAGGGVDDRLSCRVQLLVYLLWSWGNFGRCGYASKRKGINLSNREYTAVAMWEE